VDVIARGRTHEDRRAGNITRLAPQSGRNPLVYTARPVTTDYDLQSSALAVGHSHLRGHRRISSFATERAQEKRYGVTSAFRNSFGRTRVQVLSGS
jgi:hypothetical protein